MCSHNLPDDSRVAYPKNPSGKGKVPGKVGCFLMLKKMELHPLVFGQRNRGLNC